MGTGQRAVSAIATKRQQIIKGWRWLTPNQPQGFLEQRSASDFWASLKMLAQSWGAELVKRYLFELLAFTITRKLSQGVKGNIAGKK